MTANISNESEYTSGHGPMYANRRSLPEFYLYHKTHLNAAVFKQLIDNSLPHGLVIMYLMKNMRYRAVMQDAIQHEFDIDWYKGLMHRNTAPKALRELCDMNIIRNVSQSRKCRRYYVNPYIFHVMTIKQCNEYFYEYDDLNILFGPILLG